MKLYMLRHGRTLWNEAGKLQGRTDIALSEEGRRSALETGEELADVSFSAAFSSPLARARETAELILRGRDVPVQTDERLVELSFGSAEGMYLSDLAPERQPTVCRAGGLCSAGGRRELCLAGGAVPRLFGGGHPAP